jgi:hypothetical protein
MVLTLKCRRVIPGKLVRRRGDQIQFARPDPEGAPLRREDFETVIQIRISSRHMQRGVESCERNLCTRER